MFKSTFNCSHVRIKSVNRKYLPHLSSTVSYKSIDTLAHLCAILSVLQDVSHILRLLLCTCFSLYTSLLERDFVLCK